MYAGMHTVGVGLGLCEGIRLRDCLSVQTSPHLVALINEHATPFVLVVTGIWNVSTVIRPRKGIQLVSAI